MPQSVRPETHTDRDVVIAALASYAERPDADRALLAQVDTLFSAVRDQYLRARDGLHRAQGAGRAASAAADAAGRDLHRAVRLLSASTRDAEGRATPRMLASTMGGTLPSTLVTLSHGAALHKVSQLLARREFLLEMGVDPTRIADLARATDALRAAALEDDAATRRVRSLGVALAQANEDFDRTYGKVVRLFQAWPGKPAPAFALPRFQRKARRGKADGAEQDAS